MPVTLSLKVTGEYLDLLGLILKVDTSKSVTMVQTAPSVPLASTIRKMKFNNGTYVGEIVNGKGKMTTADDEVYEGDWVNDEQIKPKIISSPVSGTIRYAASEGARVKKGDKVLIIESMGMEMEIKAETSGKVHFLVPKGTLVVHKQPIAEII